MRPGVLQPATDVPQQRLLHARRQTCGGNAECCSGTCRDGSCRRPPDCESDPDCPGYPGAKMLPGQVFAVSR